MNDENLPIITTGNFAVPNLYCNRLDAFRFEKEYAQSLPKSKLTEHVGEKEYPGGIFPWQLFETTCPTCEAKSQYGTLGGLPPFIECKCGCDYQIH